MTTSGKSGSTIALLSLLGVAILARSAEAEPDEIFASGTGGVSEPSIELSATFRESCILGQPPLPRNLEAAEASALAQQSPPPDSYDYFKPSSSKNRPWIDFSDFAAGFFAGIADFSPRFKAGPEYLAGLTARVPVPAVPGNWGVFGEAFVSYIDRDLPFFYNHRTGTWFGAAAGADYTLVRGSIAYLRLQAGYEYSDWHHVNSVKNAGGILLGAELGFFWIKFNDRTSVTLTPEFIQHRKDWIVLVPLGMSFNF